MATLGRGQVIRVETFLVVVVVGSHKKLKD